jgi:hypothetical protein
MQETLRSGDAGFVVEWQLSDEPAAVIDLSDAESEVLLPVDEPVRSMPRPR